MRIPLLRLLLVGGGAAVLATAGFAYMASNTVASSYAGEGSGTVSGYSVSAIHYWTQDPPAPPGQGFVSIVGVQFTLTEMGSPPPTQNTAPTDVHAFLMTGPSGPRPLIANPPPPPPPASVASLSCTVNSWTNATASGSASCTFPSTFVSQVTGLDVEANQ